MDELQSKLFWHLLPNCSNRILLKMQDLFGALPNPQDLNSEQRSLMPEALVAAIDKYSCKPDAKFARRLDYAGDYIKRENIYLIERGSSDYPDLLANITDAPAFIYLSGNHRQLHRPQIAIVGSRSCSRAGMADAKEFSKALAKGGFTITSGLAIGIDTQAHQGAIEAKGTTLAVLGSGLDKLYPAKNRALAVQIVDQGGAILTEFMPGIGPRPDHFPRRNRIISGLSLASLIVEASERSGSLITARLALEQGRDVLVIPGSIRDPLKAGCHRLIRDGATLVTEPSQVVEQLATMLEYQLESMPCNTYELEQSNNLSASAAAILAHIEFEPIAVDDLLQLAKLHASELLEILTELELAQLITRGPYGVQRLK